MTKDIRKKILELTDKVGPDKTICPSEVARHLWPQGWREQMDEVREVAKTLREEGEIEICQKGEPVSDEKFTGPIRLRRKS